MGLIYMRMSPSGGKYIGQTKFAEEERWKTHCNEANSINHENYNSVLNKAIRKYGSENFSVKILENNLLENQLDEREIYWIDYYKTYFLDNNHGYNMTRGGESRRLLSIDNQQLKRLWEEGKSTTEISQYFNCCHASIKLRLLSLGITIKDLYNRRTEEAINTKYKNNTEKEKIFELWREGLGVSQIEEKLSIERHTISRALYWYGISQEEIKKRGNEIAHKKQSKIVLQYDKQKNLIKEWPSIKEAAETLKINTTSIINVCKGKQKTGGGYIWKYKDKT